MTYANRYNPDDAQRIIDDFWDRNRKAKFPEDRPNTDELIDTAIAANAAVRELQAAQPTCQFCDAPATCVGYGEDAPYGFACDTHCGHGGEDGECWTFTGFVEHAEKLRRKWLRQDEQLAERDARIAELEEQVRLHQLRLAESMQDTDEAREIARKLRDLLLSDDLHLLSCAKAVGSACTCGYDKAQKTMKEWPNE